jgi:hypothetical protein
MSDALVKIWKDVGLCPTVCPGMRGTTNRSMSYGKPTDIKPLVSGTNVDVNIEENREMHGRRACLLAEIRKSYRSFS